jgi:hypothetical protein
MDTKNSGLAARASALVFCAALAWSAVTGSITGTRKDPTGSVIPGVKITVKNEAQGVQTKAVTDSSGVYKFPSQSFFLKMASAYSRLPLGLAMRKEDNPSFRVLTMACKQTAV